MEKKFDLEERTFNS